MDYEQALIAQARPFMLASQLRELLAREVVKGCEGQIWPDPVALEPPYQRFSRATLEQQALAVTQPPTSGEDLVRYVVWISPEEPFGWPYSELFLKQLQIVSHRLLWEICGNEDRIHIVVTCHRRDVPVLTAAFHGQFGRCKLASLARHPLAEVPASAWEQLQLCDYFPPPPYSHLLTRPEELHVSTYQTLFASLAAMPAPTLGIYQLVFQPVDAEHDWHHNVQKLLDLEYQSKLVLGPQMPNRYPQQSPSGDLRQMSFHLETKAHNDKPFYAAAMRLAVVGAQVGAGDFLRSLMPFASLFQHGGRPLQFLTRNAYVPRLCPQRLKEMLLLGQTYRSGFLVNSWELAGLVHVPAANIATERLLPLKVLDPLTLEAMKMTTGAHIGNCDVAGVTYPVCIPDEQRHRHLHVIGKAGTGKSTTMLRLVLEDVRRGHSVIVIDPHGDLVQELLGLLPRECVERTIYFEPGDPQWIPVWNPLHSFPGQDLGRTADALVAAIKSTMKDWGDRLEHLLRHGILALLHLKGKSLLDLGKVLRRKSADGQRLRRTFSEVIDNHTAREFWDESFAEYDKSVFAPAQHKLSKLLVAGTVSLMLSQPNSSFSLPQVMDQGMILLANLSSVGPEARDVLGGFIVSLIHLTALGRATVPPERRPRVHVYCDEAHHFMTDAMENLIAETRKYNVGLTLAHQYLAQFDRRKADALSSTFSTLVFNVDEHDAAHLAKDMCGQVKGEDLVALPPWHAILRCGNQMARVQVLGPPTAPEKDFRNQIIENSRKRYCMPLTAAMQAIRQSQNALEVVPTTPSGEVEELVYDEF